MKTLLLIILLIIPAQAQEFLANKHYVVVESNHGWFSNGFPETFDKSSSLIFEDLNVFDGVDELSFVYLLKYKKQKQKILATIRMSSIQDNQPLDFVGAEFEIEIIKTKSGFKMVFEDGREVVFLEFMHFFV